MILSVPGQINARVSGRHGPPSCCPWRQGNEWPVSQAGEEEQQALLGAEDQPVTEGSRVP